MAKRVLVVDDDPDTVALVQAALRREGFEVAAAGNGAEGLLAIDACRPDLLILDVTMPIMSGYQVLQVLRDQPETKSIPVIMLTARREDVDVTRSLLGGADLHLSKPFEMRDLVTAARAILSASDPDQNPDAG